MKRRRVRITADAETDLNAIYDWVSSATGRAVAIAYVRRIRRFCFGFDLAAARGAPRHDLLPGLRIVGFERRITIAFTIDDDTVTFLRFFYGGQDWEDAFE
ncbi:type II toxin-antitoxin system RelE/ParE family toxin [Roseitalea sp. MMSF_3546]|uniref:type II toxin-antitoxin system RelE/ParE family toxin n=1 Tax=Roseitalea sp. MMSF_3546 TaxID=3046724 RepID=UPI00273EF0B3|nr:type II toxin-antitoxin system RelE/ParE family toxin [Roseitalea sp. MMSF_3546]